MLICPTTNEFAIKLCKALGLPKHTRSFDLHVEVDSVVSCKAEFYPEIKTDELETIFIEYDLVKK